MQTSRRRSDTAVVRGVDRLIALLIGSRWRAPNVGWQRHLAVFRERPTRVESADESNAAQAATQDFHDFDRAVSADRDASSRFEFAARMRHREPGSVTPVAHQQELDALSSLPFSVQARRDDTRRVEDEQVARGNQLREIAKVEMPNRPGRA